MNQTVSNNLQQIRSIIQQAHQHETETGQLRAQLDNDIEALHNAIQLPNDNSSEALCRFVVDYVEHVPSFIEAIYNLATEANIEDSVLHILDMASNFFLEPPQLLESYSGMTALMDEAYLAHRLMEEINDRFISWCGQPLAPMDMTRSNLIVHHLIGEPFANELDSAVQYSVELLMSRRNLLETDAFKNYVNEHKSRGWGSELSRWPCLAEDLAITLSFSTGQSFLH